MYNETVISPSELGDEFWPEKSRMERDGWFAAYVHYNDDATISGILMAREATTAPFNPEEYLALDLSAREEYLRTHRGISH